MLSKNSFLQSVLCSLEFRKHQVPSAHFLIRLQLYINKMTLIIFNSETFALKQVLLRESCFLRKINVTLSNINFTVL